MQSKLVWFIFVICLVSSLSPASTPPAAPAERAESPDHRASTSAMFLVDDSIRPNVRIAWPTRDGGERVLEGERPYESPVQKSPLGANIEVYVALGGTRLDRGQGQAEGLIVRVGFYKAQPNEAFFEDIAPAGPDGGPPIVRVSLGPIRFSRPACPAPGTMLQHVQFTLDELAACGIGGASRDQFNTADPRDTHTDRLTPADSRRGVLHVRVVGAGEAPVPPEIDASMRAIEASRAPKPGTESSAGDAPEDLRDNWLSPPAEVTLLRIDERTFRLEAALPYALLRHIEDPWRVTTPGTFQEPSHFHLEVEVLPEGVAPQEPNRGRPLTDRGRPPAPEARPAPGAGDEDR